MPEWLRAPDSSSGASDQESVIIVLSFGWDAVDPCTWIGSVSKRTQNTYCGRVEVNPDVSGSIVPLLTGFLGQHTRKYTRCPDKFPPNTKDLVQYRFLNSARFTFVYLLVCSLLVLLRFSLFVIY